MFEAFASHDWASKWERSGFLGSAVTAPSDARNAGRTDCKPESCRSSPRAAYTTVIVTMDARVPRLRRLTQRQRMSCSPEWPDVDVRPSTTLRASGEPPPVPPNSLATTLRSATSASWSVVQDQHQPAPSELGTSGRLEGVADALDESADDWVPSYRKMKAPTSTATAWPDSSPYASAMQTLAQLSNPVEPRPTATTATDQQAIAGRRHSAALPLHGGRVLNKSRSPSPDGSLPPGVDYSVRSSGGGLQYKSRSPSPDGSLLPFNAGSSARGGSGRLQYKSRSPSPDSSLPPGVDSSVRSSDGSLPHYGGRAEAPANWLSDSHMAPAGGSRGNLRQEEHAARAAADLAAHAAASAAAADAAERAARDAVLVSHISRAMGERRRHELLRQQQNAPPAQAERQLQQEQLLQQQWGPPGQPARQGTRRAEQAAAQAHLQAAQAQQQAARKQEAETARKQEAEAAAALREEAKQRVAVGTTVSLVPKCLKAPDPATGPGIGKAQQTMVSSYIVI